MSRRHVGPVLITGPLQLASKVPPWWALLSRFRIAQQRGGGWEVYTHAHAHAHARTCSCTCTRMHMHTHIHTHTHAHVHAHACTCTRTHTCTVNPAAFAADTIASTPLHNSTTSKSLCSGAVSRTDDTVRPKISKEQSIDRIARDKSGEPKRTKDLEPYFRLIRLYVSLSISLSLPPPLSLIIPLSAATYTHPMTLEVVAHKI